MNELRAENLRRGEQLCTGLVTETITVKNGNDYQLTIAGDNGATAVCSGAFTGTLTADGSNRISWPSGTPKTSGSTSLTITVTGTLTEMFLEDVTGDTNQNPGEYIPAGEADGTSFNYAGGVRYYGYQKGNTVNGAGVVTEVKGADLTTAWGALFEPAATNLVIDSRDLTQWTQGGTNVSVYNEVGIGGEPNTATTLTDDNPAGFENVYRSHSITPGAPSCLVVWIKKDADTSRYPMVRLQRPATLDVYLNTSTGEVTLTGDTSNGDTLVSQIGEFWKLTIEHTGPGTVHAYEIYPAATTVPGFTQGEAVGSIIVGQVDGYDNTSKEIAHALTPIFTSGSTQNRTADDGSPMFEKAGNYQGALTVGGHDSLSLRSTSQVRIPDPLNELAQKTFPTRF